jgi:hypothetical protein
VPADPVVPAWPVVPALPLVPAVPVVLLLLQPLVERLAVRMPATATPMNPTNARVLISVMVNSPNKGQKGVYAHTA